ncbi:glycosyltransferase [Georgenia wangjunii]|uniref:glycosyltransferase n=1 Tax=Georgenia wangjunii TaxID=3117730 RepID=UPI002F26C5D5
MTARYGSRTETPKILFGVTSGHSVRGFFSGFHQHLARSGWNVALTCSNEGDPRTFAESEGARYIPLSAARDPRPIRDLATLLALIRILRVERPAIAVWGSPKLGLLGTIASRLTRTPSIYVVHGLRLETTSGATRFLLSLSERLAIACATSTVAVGYELRRQLVHLRLAREGEVEILHNGSANGVAPLSAPDSYRSRDGSYIGFVGRITPDKGLADLADAWTIVRNRCPGAELHIAGAAEDDGASRALENRLARTPGVRLMGHQSDLSDFYRGMRALALPSYREGLPNVVLEAASYGVPTVASNATGASEAVIANHTGLSVPVGDSSQLANALCRIISNDAEAALFGLNAYDHILSRYNQSDLWRAWTEHIKIIADETERR